MFGFVGKTAEEAAALAQQVVAVETQLAAARLDKVARRDPAKRYNPKTTEELGEIAKSIAWPSYFNAIGAKGIESVVITDLGYFSALDKLMQNNSVEEIKAYLWWTLIDGTAGRSAWTWTAPTGISTARLYAGLSLKSLWKNALFAQ